jgi:NADPH:quinone reductase-like Zn-dependent oxidoreductase
MLRAMKAIQFETYGGSEVLHVVDVADPHPVGKQVRLRVKTVGVNPMDIKLRSGAMKNLLPTTFPSIPGMELAGVIDELGPDATGWKVGDEVFGWSETGAYAEYALATQVVRKPTGLAWDAAVAVPVAGDTSNRVLDLLAIKAGETLLIHGGAGAVGALAVQLAVHRGARVIATASPADQDYVRSLGAKAVTYGDGLASRIAALGLAPHAGAPHGIDAVLDTAGKGALPVSIELRGDKSRIVTIADMAAQSLGIPFSAGQAGDRNLARVEEVGKLVAAGKVKVVVGATFPLAEASQAQDKVMAAGHTGKIVLTVG